MSRRRFARWVVSSATVVASAPLLGCGDPGKVCQLAGDDDGMRAALDIYFRGRTRELAPVARAYLDARSASGPTCETADALIRPVMALLGPETTPLSGAAKLAQEVRADFEGDAVAVVDGWVLSETEAAAALLADRLEGAAS